MHHLEGKVDAARPFDASKIRIDSNGVENAGVEQFKKDAATTFRFDPEKPRFRTVVECDFQLELRKWFLAETIRIICLFYSKEAILEEGR